MKFWNAFFAYICFGFAVFVAVVNGSDWLTAALIFSGGLNFAELIAWSSNES